MSARVYLKQSVYDAAMVRIAVAFRDFDNVLIAFSGGKDSGICVQLCLEYATQHGCLDKLAVYHQDYEAGYPQTFDYVQRVFESLPMVVRRYWLCLPIRAACAVSMHQTSWIPWDRDQQEIWVRPMPQEFWVVNEDSVWFPFRKGTKGFDFRIMFAEEFAKQNGSTAVIIGLRAEESLSRQAIITAKGRRYMHNGLTYTKLCKHNTCNFYPIYDWTTDDVWVANGRKRWDYNRLYDLFYQAGMSIYDMRTASPFHQCGQGTLKYYRAICPDMWGKMIGRVNGVNFTCIYGGTTAMGWKDIKKPDHFTWKQYAEFLLGTLPEATRKKYLAKIEKSIWHWREQGGGRSREFIEQLEREGAKVRRTHAPSPHCKVNVDKEHIYIDEMFDDTEVDEFKKAPSWKRVCVAIMKNDIQCLTMGFSRTKTDMERRKAILAKYKDL